MRAQQWFERGADLSAAALSAVMRSYLMLHLKEGWFPYLFEILISIRAGSKRIFTCLDPVLLSVLIELDTIFPNLYCRRACESEREASTKESIFFFAQKTTWKCSFAKNWTTKAKSFQKCSSRLKCFCLLFLAKFQFLKTILIVFLGDDLVRQIVWSVKNHWHVCQW